MADTSPPVAEIPCAVCGRDLEAVHSDPETPYGADIFRAEGHYGSTMYDPPSGEHLELLICQACLTVMRGQGRVLRVFHPTQETPGKRMVFGSDEDKANYDNPLNRLRLRNESGMVEFLDTAAGMNADWAERIHEACHAASSRGDGFDPGTVPSHG